MDDEMILFDIDLRFEEEGEETIALLFEEEEEDTIPLRFEDAEPAEDSAPAYEGEYAVIPGEETQTLATAGCVLDQDIVIRPVPPDYGRIIYDGSILTIY